jgi:hypothetical protein
MHWHDQGSPASPIPEVPIMRTPSIILIAVLCAGFIGSSCSGPGRSDYPDKSPETTRKVDEVKRTARERKEQIDRDYNDQTTRLEFRERQIREQAKADREAAAIEVDRSEEKLAAKKRDLEIQAKYDKEKADAEMAEKLKTSPGEQAETIKSDAMRRKAEIDAKLKNDSAPFIKEREEAKAKASQRKRDIDAEESKQLAALRQEMADARAKMRSAKLDVDRWTNDELEKIGKESRENATAKDGTSTR